jgi:hypothetical protein
MRLNQTGSEILSSYWKNFESISVYNCLMNKNPDVDLIVTRDQSYSTGKIQRDVKSGGALILLPDIDLFGNFYEEVEVQEDGHTVTEMHFSDDARAFSLKLVAEVIAIDKALSSNTANTPEPNWSQSADFSTTKEKEVTDKIGKVEQRLAQLEEEKSALASELQAASNLKKLTYETGKPLEGAIREALEILGFSAENYRDSNSEFDVVFESGEGRFIGEAEGKDSKPINITKLRQLALNVHEDLSRDEVSKPAKAVLFGNGMRLTQPKERGIQFTEKCIQAATETNIALVATTDLFRVAKHISDSNDEDFKAACRAALISQVGIVSFPTPSEL